MIRNLPLCAVLIAAAVTATSEADSVASQPASSLGIVTQDGTHRVEVLCGGRPLVSSPEEGLWSIATDWREGWAADWHHVKPDKLSRAGEWTILEGELELPGGIVDPPR